MTLVRVASNGIGRATAETLNPNGYRVFTPARRLERLATIQAPSLEPIRLDVTEEASDGAAFDRIKANAGCGLYGSVEEVTREEARRQFDVNVFALARVTLRRFP